MNDSLVSVCIPTYNSEKFIEDSIRAVLAQSYSNIEVVVVDDCSSDNTVDIVKKLCEEDSRVRLICNPVNLGMTQNWNKCVLSCRGRYVKLIPADDIIYKDCIKTCVRVLEKHDDVFLVVVGTDLINNDNQKVGQYIHGPFNGVYQGKKISKISVLLNNFYGSPVNSMFRLDDFKKVGGFDDNIPYILDYDLWISLAGLGRVCFIKKNLSAFRVRDDSNSGKLMGLEKKKYTDEHIRLYDKHIRLKNVNLNRFERFLAILSRKIRNVIINDFINRKKSKK